MSDHDESLDKFYESFYKHLEQEVNQTPFYQNLRQDINQLRELAAKLAQALEIAKGLHEETIRVIKDAKNHVDDELQAATELWNDRLG